MQPNMTIETAGLLLLSCTLSHYRVPGCALPSHFRAYRTFARAIHTISTSCGNTWPPSQTPKNMQFRSQEDISRCILASRGCHILALPMNLDIHLQAPLFLVANPILLFAQVSEILRPSVNVLLESTGIYIHALFYIFSSSLCIYTPTRGELNRTGAFFHGGRWENRSYTSSQSANIFGPPASVFACQRLHGD